MSGPVTFLSTPPKRTDTGILRLGAPEFVPRSQPLEDTQYFLSVGGPGDSHSSIVEEEGPNELIAPEPREQ